LEFVRSACRSITINADTRYIIMAGVAGGLDPKLAIGDLILGDCPETLMSGMGIPHGSIHTSDQLASSMQEKSELYIECGASVVDMETAKARDFAAERNIPFISLRAVSDSANHSLDPSLLTLVDAWGRPRPTAIARFLAANPLRARSLIQLSHDSSLAARRLGEGVIKILEQIAIAHPVP